MMKHETNQKKWVMKGARTILKPEMSWFGQVYIPWPLWPVHSTSFTPGLVHFYTPCHVATRDLPLRSSAATLHVVGPIAGLAAVVRVRFLGRPSRPQRPSGTSSWSESPARWPRVARVVAAQPVRPRTVRPLRPSGPAGSRARLSAARIAGRRRHRARVRVASHSDSPPSRSRVAGPSAPPRTVRGGTARWPRP